MATLVNARASTFKQKGMTLEQTQLLCVEPSTKQIFSLNMGTQTAEEVVLEHGQEIKNKIEREEYKMDQLLDRQENYHKWFFQNETAQNFRRQMVPFYLLEMESNLYPVYIDNSNIDESLTSDFKIHEIRIKMSESIWDTIKNQDSLSHRADVVSNKMSIPVKKQGMRQTINEPASKNSLLIQEMPSQSYQSNIEGIRPFTASPTLYNTDFTCFTLKDVSLLCTADKVIKKCEKEIEQLLKSRFNFRETQNKMQILKFKSVDSYAYGETQLIYFVEIREYLRARAKDQKKPLELVLISLSDTQMVENRGGSRASGLQRQKTSLTENQPHMAHQFPPLIENRIQISPFPNQQSNAHGQSLGRIGSISEEKQRSAKKSAVGSQKLQQSFQRQLAQRYKNVSIFGWYTPFKFTKKSGPVENDPRFALPASMVQTQSMQAATETECVQRSASYSTGEKFRINRRRQEHGHVSFLKDPNRGLIPYEANCEILKSCDVRFPLKISLLALKDLTNKLQYEAFDKKKDNAKELRLISYVVLQESQNQEVMNLLAACQAISQNQVDDGLLRKNLIHPFGNQALNKNYNQGFQKMKFKVQKTKFHLLKKRSEKVFTMRPQYVQVQAALYLGCRRISTFSYSKPTLYQNEIDFSGDFLQFYKPRAKMRLLKQKELDEEMSTPEIPGEVLKIDCLPSCARLCFNVILLPEQGSCSVIKADKQFVHEEQIVLKEDLKRTITQKFVQREGFVLGSCQVSLFDETFLIRQGKRECRLWPFESFQPRMVCQGECFEKNVNTEIYKPNTISNCMTIQIEFQSFAGKVGWRLQKDEVRKNDRFSNKNYKVISGRAQTGQNHGRGGNRVENDVSHKQATTFENVNLENETKSLKQVKRLLDAYPNEPDDDDEGELEVDKVLEYRNYIHKMPIFIRLIDFTDHEKISICYDTLDGSGLAKDMLPEESLALLDGQFGDIKVRIFAVKKLSMLNDSQIALFMPQLIQALKYELFHHSPLAEFLLEKALKNTRVVGHAFFWSLKANLHWPHSRERFYLILERFLMCCGQFKNDFIKQVLVNRSLVELSKMVNEKLDNEGASKEYTKMFMHKQLKKEEIKIKLTQQLIIAHAKYDDMYFKANGMRHDPQATSNTENEIENSEQFNSRRRDSGKGSSGGEGGGTEQRRFSNKLIKSDGSSSQPEQYEFNEKAIEKFINSEVDQILGKLKFPMDEKEEDQGKDGSRKDRDKKGISPRSQAMDPSLNELYYNRWKVDWQSELLYIPFAPKNPFSSFADKGGSIFLSKKKPLLIVCNLANEQETEAALSAQNNQTIDYNKHEPLKSLPKNHIVVKKKSATDSEGDSTVLKKFLFKFGDDLRQDNLVLQFFKIMDRLWQSSGDDLQMMCYDVMETGFGTGYIEFIDNATVITQMHKDESFLRGPFRETSVLHFFMNKMALTKEFTVAKNKQQIKDRLREYNNTFLHSLAGQCVATYVLGIRDRHPGNFMLHDMTGTFFHIDFGHFLGHGKKKLGFSRDREPFILSNELHYFLKYFCQVDVRQATNKEDQKNKKTPLSKTSEDLKVQEFEKLNGDKGDQAAPEEIKEQLQEEKVFELFFNQEQTKNRKDKQGLEKRKRPTPEYFEELFEKLASQAFLKIRQNADIFINLLVLMLVAGLDELDQPSIGFVKRALFLNVSEEEATVQFKQTIDQARKQWYRSIDNLFHVISDYNKDKKQQKKEAQATKKGKK